MSDRIIDPKRAVRRAIGARANPRLYFEDLINRYVFPIIKEGILAHFISEGKDAVDFNGNAAAPWTGKTKRNLDIRAARGVPLDLPVLFNSGRLRRFIRDGLTFRFRPESSILFVGVKVGGRPSYAEALDSGAYIPHSPFGPIQLAKRPLLRINRWAFQQIQGPVALKLKRHFLGDPAIPGYLG